MGGDITAGIETVGCVFLAGFVLVVVGAFALGMFVG